MTKKELDAPPGLKIQNRWESLGTKELESKDEKEQEKRSEDLKEMERTPKEYEETFPKMGNYSKRQVNKPRFQPVCKTKMRELNLFAKVPLKESPKVLCPAISEETGGWLKMKSVMDSGASESVASPLMFPDYEVRPSAGSRRGQEYTAANGENIPNLGEQVLSVVMEDGREGNIKYQSCDVSRPLNSVSEICDAGGEQGQIVVFNKWGGEIYNPQTGRSRPFQREDGIYTLQMWVRPNKPSGFTRPGE